MGRPKGTGKGRTARGTSVSLLPHTAQALDDCGISATEAVRRYADYLLDNEESTLIERRIQMLRWEIEDLEKKKARAVEREARVRGMGK